MDDHSHDKQTEHEHRTRDEDADDFDVQEEPKMEQSLLEDEAEPHARQEVEGNHDKHGDHGHGDSHGDHGGRTPDTRRCSAGDFSSHSCSRFQFSYTARRSGSGLDSLFRRSQAVSGSVPFSL